MNQLYQGQPFQIVLLENNFSLASNQGMKKFNIAIPTHNPGRKSVLEQVVDPDEWDTLWHRLADEPAGGKTLWMSLALKSTIYVSNADTYIDGAKTTRALFWDSLPDVASELMYAYKNKKYIDMVSGAFTAVTNASLLVFHVVAQSVQLFSQILTLPTIFTGMALRRSEAADSTAARWGFGALAVLSAIVTAPFQVFSVIANTIGYVRHVVDGAVTFGKAFVNMLIDGALGLIKWGVTGDKRDAEAALNNFKKNLGQMWYGFTDTIKNAFRLVPAAATLAIAYFTGGLSLAATSIAAAVLSTTVGAVISQAISVMRIKVGDLLNPLFKKIDEWVERRLAPSVKEVDAGVEMQQTGCSHSGPLKCLNTDRSITHTPSLSNDNNDGDELGAAAIASLADTREPTPEPEKTQEYGTSSDSTPHL